MAYGTASGPDDIERYYTDIRGGRAPSPEHLAELRERYAAIGNRFPLLEITRRQAEGLERALNARRARDVPLVPRHEALAAVHRRGASSGCARDGIERAVGIVMAPHWSGMSVETYVERVRDAAGDGPPRVRLRPLVPRPPRVRGVPRRPRGARARRADAGRTRGRDRDLLGAQPAGPDGRRRLAPMPALHGMRGELPVPGRPAGDGGPRGRRARARAAHDRVAERGPHGRPVVGTAGRGGDRASSPPRGARPSVVCSAGFVADHLEILYDLDIEARQVAEQAGIRFVRTEMPNDDPAFIAVLADVVQRAARSVEGLTRRWERASSSSVAASRA